MKAVKIILNIFGIILASILSIVLFAMLIATPIVSATTNLTKPETIQQIVSDIDVAEIISNSTEGEELPIPAEAIDQVLESNAAKEIIELYSEEISAAFAGEATQGITPEKIKSVLNENVDELIDIVYPYVPQEEQISKEEIKTGILQMVDENAEEISQMLPDVKEILNEQAQSEPELAQAISFVGSGTLAKACIIATAILSVLIYALRFPRFKGFMWLGSVYFIATAIMLIVGFAGTSASALLLETVPSEASGIVAPLTDAIFGNITNAALVMLALTVAFIAAFILCRIFVVNRKKKAEVAVEQTADAAPAAIE